MWITPEHLDSDFPEPRSIEDKITIFVAQTRGWQLRIADQCLNGNPPHPPIPHSGYAVLHITFSYFEMIAKYRDGYTNDNASRRYFKKGVREVFPAVDLWPDRDNKLNRLYAAVRCGLYHAGVTMGNVILKSDEAPITYKEDPVKHIAINPHALVERLFEHFQSFEEELRDVSKVLLRSNFQKRFDEVRKPAT